MSEKDKNRDPSQLTLKEKAGVKVGTMPENLARLAATSSAVQAASAMHPWSKQAVGDVDITALVDHIESQNAAMRSGDMSEVEGMLYAQAMALQAAFTALSRRAEMNSREYPKATEIYFRLALKAQSQCRSTLEALAEIKNPRPVAFIKQGNFAQTQQVNNGPVNDPRAREEKFIQPNELLTNERAIYGNSMDTSATSTTGGSNQALAAVERVDGAAHG